MKSVGKASLNLNQQIQELAARRLEAILEPRNVKPQLLEQLRRSAGTAPEIPASTPLETYEFEDTTLYETHRGILRFFRRLLNPILKLFFNPTPLINALNTQVRINKALATRELERERAHFRRLLAHLSRSEPRHLLPR